MNTCPFCGSAKLKFFARMAGGYVRHYIGQVHCMSCGARGPAVKSPHMDYRETLSPIGVNILQKMAFDKFNCKPDEQQANDALPLFGGGEQ